jgi:type I restriction enzyme, S subunit
MIPDNFVEIKFSDLGKIITGKTPQTEIKRYWSGNIPFITPKDIQVNKFINHTERCISDDGLQTVLGQLLPKDSICVSCIGNIGYVGLTVKDSITNQQINSIVPNSKYSSDYIFYLMKSYWPIFKSLENQSTTVSILNKSQFSSLTIKVTESKQKQESITEILSSIDDKIELNNKINSNLEELAQTLYKHWFVDFEFPNKEGKPYKSSGGEMVESELGMIPKGWRIVALSEIVDIVRGLSYKGKHLNDSGTPMINLGNIEKTGRFNYKKVKYYNGEHNNKHIVKSGDIIIANTDMTSNREILGTPILVPSTYEKKIIFSHHLYALKNPRLDKAFVFYYLKSKTFKNIAENYANGTTVLSISKTDIEKARILIPDEASIKAFSNLASLNIKKIFLHEYQNIALSDLRDLLLPKLMSGEIEV